MTRLFFEFWPWFLLGLFFLPAGGAAASPPPGPPLSITRATGAIAIDGDLSDAGWQGADSVTTWFETRVGDNVEPQVKNVAYLTYDDAYLYVGFVLADPHPASIRAPLGDHDAISDGIDYAGVAIDSKNDGKSARIFLADPRGLQYDAVTADATGEDSSPDFFWDAAGKITATGWTLEMRIPFSSLRYDPSQSTWGIILYRNYPRDRPYRFFSTRQPREATCFVCTESRLSGLSHLPSGSHLVLAPFSTFSQSASPSSDLGSPLHHEPVQFDAGGDVKWIPSAALAVDATLNPDFSQIESDVAQIAANERFALSYPEKRPFFLEGVDLLATTLSAVYTRTITDPAGGVRATGRAGRTSYVALATQDEGGGLVVIPGAQSSTFAPQDFVSNVGIVRLKHDLGLSYVSLLANTRRVLDGGWNAVAGPDFNWRPEPSNSIAAQLLFSATRTPNRPDLAAEWDGRTLADHAFQGYWAHQSPSVDWVIETQDIGNDFRADNGFIPQVGYREAYLQNGYTIRPQDAFLSKARFFLVNFVDWESEHDDRILTRRHSFGTALEGKLNSSIHLECNWDAVRVGDDLLHRFRPRLSVEASPGQVINSITAEVLFGEEIDYANAREGHGVTLNGTFLIRPNGQIELSGNLSRRWLDVPASTGSGRLFVAEVERLRGVYTFNARTFIRLIGQFQQTRRSPDLYELPVDGRSALATGSAVFAYKINWQTVVYLGFGNQSEYSGQTDDFENAGWQWFSKVSYAWQR